jgi:hypothetical protein
MTHGFGVPGIVLFHAELMLAVAMLGLLFGAGCLLRIFRAIGIHPKSLKIIGFPRYQ